MKRECASCATARKRLLQFAVAIFAASVAALGISWASMAQGADAGAYPNRAVRVAVPFAAGSQIDIAARLVCGKLADALGQSFVIENYPGASGNIGSEVVARAAPDGYTLLFTGSLITLLPSIMGAQAVDPVAAFAPISKVGEPPIVILVHPSINVSTLPELIALAKRQPGRIAYASSGIGTVPHLVASVISREAGIEMIHVPYANSGQALKDLLSGEVPVYFAFLGPTEAHIRSGQSKALAVASHRRMRAWPDIPTVVELGYKDAAADPWNGLLAPAGTPPQIIELLSREVNRVVQMSDVRDRFALMGMDPLTTSPEQFQAEIKEAVARWPAIAKAAGVRAP